MFELFSTREIATAFYLLIIFAGMLNKQKMRKSFKKLIQVACTKKLVIPFLLFIAYAIGITFSLSKLPLWKNIYIKDIIIWTLFSGIPVCYKAISKGEEEYYFRDIFLDNIKGTALIEFFIGTFTFNIVIELIMQPVMFFWCMMQVVAGLKEEMKAVKKLADVIMCIIGILVIFFTLKAAMGSYKDINATDTMVSFCIPIVFSILYIPCAYIFALIAKYEVLFMRMSFKEPQDKKIRFKHRWLVFKVCGFSLEKVCYFQKECVKHMYILMKQEEFEQTINALKNSIKRKNNVYYKGKAV